MKSVNTKGLMLGLLAIGGLIAGGAMFTTGQAYATILNGGGINNAAVAANSDDDTVTQVNAAEVKQKSETKCEAKVSDDDVIQVGDNINTAANDCDTTQTATVAQANVNTDNDVQVADATACQAIAGLVAANICDVVVITPPEEPVYCLTEDIEVEQGAPRVRQISCFETEQECEDYENAPAGIVVSDCQRFERPPPGAVFP